MVRCRYLAHLTTPELERYMTSSVPTVILPVGCVEMHGPHQPIGTDSIIAEAFSLRLANGLDGLVLPTLHYSWAGATDGFAGTFSIEPEIAPKAIESIMIKADRQGFRRCCFVSIHSPNHYTLYSVPRRLYETHGIPVLFIEPFRPYTNEARDLFSGPYERAMEASVVLAAMNILGHSDGYSESDMAYELEPVPVSPALSELAEAGTIGFSMQDMTQHACPSNLVSCERGMEFINAQVDFIVPRMKHLDVYRTEIRQQSNQGWWRL